MRICTERAAAAAERRYELLLRTGNGWTSMGRFSGFHAALTVAVRCSGEFIIDDSSRRRPLVRRV